MFAKLRSFGVGLVVAHQDLDQLSKVRGLEQAVLANARTKIVFQTSARDARAMQREYGKLVEDEDFISLGAYEAIARVATSEGVSTPITLITAPPSKPTGVANAVRAASRTAYGRPIADVEAEIDARRRVTGTAQNKPKLGTQKWG
jgi:DNA helicase HerA-like ATPase